MLQAARIRNRSVSESAREDTLKSSEYLLSDDYNTLPNAQESHLSQFRIRAGSFGSKLYHSLRRNDSASSSQRDLNKQQPRNQRQSSGFSTKPSEASKSQVTARERTQASFKSEASKSVTIKADGSSTSQK